MPEEKQNKKQDSLNQEEKGNEKPEEQKQEKGSIAKAKDNLEEQAEGITETNKGDEILKWSFPEFIEYDRSRNWYIAAIGLVVVAVVYSIVVANFLFAIFLILFTGIVLFQIRSTPQKVEFKIFEKGVSVGESFYEWSDIKTFSIIEEKPQKVYFDLRNSILPDLSIPLESQDFDELREVLGSYLNEDTTKKGENIIDKLSRWLKI